jgi:hypothetical protein
MHRDESIDEETRAFMAERAPGVVLIVALVLVALAALSVLLWAPTPPWP